jgi:hypothetical protein
MTTLEIIYEIKEQLQINSDDRAGDIPEPLILFTYEKNRALWLSQYFNRGSRHVDQELYQTIKLEVEKVDASICPEIPVGCTILRTKEELPSNIISLHNSYLANVGPLDVSKKRYMFKPDGEYVNLAISGRFANGIYSYPKGSHLYFTSKSSFVKSIKNVALSAIFEQPSIVIEKGKCLSGNCEKYPMKLQYHTQVMQLTVQGLMAKFALPKDTDNNSNSDMYQVPQQKQTDK